MIRVIVVLVAGALVLGAALLVAHAQSSVPGDIASYRSWTRMNSHILDDPSNKTAGPKNTFVNLSPAQLSQIYGAGSRVRQSFPEGATIVRETLDPQGGFVRVLFVMRYTKTAPQTKDWVFSGYQRAAADRPFEPVSIADPVARCLNCHAQMQGADYVFTPYVNRPDPLPGRTGSPGRVEIFNAKFGTAPLHVKVGSPVTWVNYDFIPHDVKAVDKSFESGNVAPFGVYTMTFTKPGTVDYFCGIHLEMRGQIVVEQ